jgi:hypothetical protein
MNTTDKKLFCALGREALRVKANIEVSENEAEVRELLRLYFLLGAAILRLRNLSNVR